MGTEARLLPVGSVMTFQQNCPVHNSVPPPLAPPKEQNPSFKYSHNIIHYHVTKIRQ